jgi:integrase
MDYRKINSCIILLLIVSIVGLTISMLGRLINSIIDNAVEYIPRKTKEERAITVRAPLNETAKQLIEKYKDYERSSLFPYNTEQDYNRKIKESFKKSGLDRIVTVLDQQTREEVQRALYEVASFHMARRSFIGNIYKKVKDPNLVGALSGHKEGSKAFTRYRTIDDDMEKELINLLD